MQATFRSADLLGKSSSRVVFDIAGNGYRMICKYAFGDKQVHLFVSWIVTHAATKETINNLGKLYPPQEEKAGFLPGGVPRNFIRTPLALA